ncbi:Synerg-CTERM sorting domain-containing protein [Cloacibacillus porcorum]|uniref:Synerg-CTERM sorting domain-containing protein n=1 Tax=Cloacibacillus porcorum TaxID=1197717 RepID=UPI003F0B8237
MITLNTSKSYANNIFISNGEFHGAIDIEGYDKTPENFQITGGAFSVDPSKYLKDDYKAEKGADNLYHVQRKPAINFEKKELTLSEGERRDITAMIFGVTEGKYDVTADSSSTAVKVENVSYNGDSATITVSGQHVGESVLTATLTYGEETKSADCTITVSGATPTPGPIDPAPKPVKPVIGNVPDDVKAEIKPELAATEGDPAAAAKKIGGALTAEQLTRNKDGNTIVEPEVAVKAANKLGTLSSVTTKDVVALPVFTTPAIDANKDKTIMISYLILGSDLKAKKPADVKVMKILGAENGELFTYASAITKDMDKKFTVMKDDDSGTIFTGDIDGYTMYHLALFIKDGGKFDLDGKKDGAVADPTVILGAEKRAPSGGSGGCNAGLGVLALLLSLAALPLVYKRKK